jgi:hypothetical protein
VCTEEICESGGDFFSVIGNFDGWYQTRMDTGAKRHEGCVFPLLMAKNKLIDKTFRNL